MSSSLRTVSYTHLVLDAVGDVQCIVHAAQVLDEQLDLLVVVGTAQLHLVGDNTIALLGLGVLEMCIRDSLNTTFLTMAMYAGLDLAIMNPSSEEMMAAVYAYNVLTNRDLSHIHICC